MPPLPSGPAGPSGPSSSHPQQRQQQQHPGSNNNNNININNINNNINNMLAAQMPMPIASHMRNGNGAEASASAAWKTMTPKRERLDADEHSSSQKASKKQKRKGGKACVYCRRSHMVCEGGRPCERCIKRDIAHLCRDVTPPSSSKKGDGPPNADLEDIATSAESQAQPPLAPPAQPQAPPPAPPPQQPTAPVSQDQLVYDTGASWPLLPDTSAGTDTIDLGAIAREASGGGAWGENAEFGILSDMLKTLRVPTLPGGFVDVLSQVVNNTVPPMNLDVNNNNATASGSGSGNDSGNGTGNRNASTSASNLNNGNVGSRSASSNNAITSAPADPKGKGKGKGKAKEPFSTVSRIEQYLLAAADQPHGSRASRLTQVIRAKYEAGLLKPYDYIKGYERMNRWMDSGRAAREGTASRASSPSKGSKPHPTGPSHPSGSSISPESRRRILAALEGFRPRFRRIAKELTDLDLVFVEEANERLMLQYDRALASIHTPSCIWRRTGEIQKANQEFAQLTGIPAPLFRNGQLCVYELMDEDSAVRFWEGYGKVAFEKGQSHMYTHCTLKIPLSLTRKQSRTQANTPAHPTTLVAVSTVPEFSLPPGFAMTPIPSSQGATGPGGAGAGGGDASSADTDPDYRVIKTCFSITIRRDRYGIPVAIMGQWIPIGNNY